MVKHHQNKLEFNAEQDQNCRELLKIAVEKAKVLPPTLTTCRGYKNFLLNRNSITTMAKNLVAPANANKSSNKDSLQVETSEVSHNIHKMFCVVE